VLWQAVVPATGAVTTKDPAVFAVLPEAVNTAIVRPADWLIAAAKASPCVVDPVPVVKLVEIPPKFSTATTEVPPFGTGME